MTFPIKHPNNTLHRESGMYRGFPVRASAGETLVGGSDTVTTFSAHLYVRHPPLPHAFVIGPWSFSYDIWYRNKNSDEGGVTVGYPPFDRRFMVYGDDLKLIRHVMNSNMVHWLSSIDWDRSALSGMFITLGYEEMAMKSGGPDSLTAQHIVDFMIDFLLHTPPEIWPEPLPGMVSQP